MAVTSLRLPATTLKAREPLNIDGFRAFIISQELFPKKPRVHLFRAFMNCGGRAPRPCEDTSPHGQAVGVLALA